MKIHPSRSGILSLALFALVGSISHAGVITQSVRVGGSLSSLTTEPIDKFDSSLGDLSGVRIDLTGIVLTKFIATVVGPNMQDHAFFHVTTTIYVDSYLSGNFSGRGTASFEALNDATGERSTSGPAYAYALGTATTTLFDPAILNSFKSNAPTTEELSLAVTSFPLSSSLVEVSSTIGFLTGELSVSYFYDQVSGGAGAEAANAAVPEPSTLAILGLGAVVMVRSRRRSRTKPAR